MDEFDEIVDHIIRDTLDDCLIARERLDLSVERANVAAGRAAEAIREFIAAYNESVGRELYQQRN